MPLFPKKDIFEIINLRTKSIDYEREHTAEELIKGYTDKISLPNKVKSLNEAIIKIV